MLPRAPSEGMNMLWEIKEKQLWSVVLVFLVLYANKNILLKRKSCTSDIMYKGRSSSVARDEKNV